MNTELFKDGKVTKSLVKERLSVIIEDLDLLQNENGIPERLKYDILVIMESAKSVRNVLTDNLEEYLNVLD